MGGPGGRRRRGRCQHLRKALERDFPLCWLSPSGIWVPAGSAPPSTLDGRDRAAPPPLAPARQSGRTPWSAQGCARRLRPSAAGRGLGGAWGTPRPPRGTAQVRAEAADLERGSAPISQTGKLRRGGHSPPRGRWVRHCRGEAHSRRTNLPDALSPPSRRPSGAEAQRQAARNQAAASSCPPTLVRASSQWGPPQCGGCRCDGRGEIETGLT